MVACEGERLSAGHHAASSASSAALPSTPRGRAPRAPSGAGIRQRTRARGATPPGSREPPARALAGRAPARGAGRPDCPREPRLPPRAGPPGAGSRTRPTWKAPPPAAGALLPGRGPGAPCAAAAPAGPSPAPRSPREPVRRPRAASHCEADAERGSRGGEVRAPAFAPHSGVAGAFSAPPGGLRWRRRRRPRGAPDQHPAEGPERMARRDRLERRRRRKSGSFGALPGICPGDSFFATLDTLSRGGGQRLQLANRTANRPPWFGCGSALRRWQEKQSSACLGLPKECIGADKKAIWQSSGL
ncbi:uncharacterized protein LOC142436378 [Tenrec ecaudatus]|uniref:uncharacterized protein LOC142436378 n=1 Tax=Tenrec ecaudatus TaxID=94439 RepID=UPI003F595527